MTPDDAPIADDAAAAVDPSDEAVEAECEFQAKVSLRRRSIEVAALGKLAEVIAAMSTAQAGLDKAVMYTSIKKCARAAGRIADLLGER